MDLGQIIYIIAIIAYFIYQASKKKKSMDVPDSGENQPQAPQKGLTFEEILKEIRNAQNPPAAETPRPPMPEPARARPIPPNFPEAKVQQKKRFEPVEEVDDEATYYEGAFGFPAKNNPYQSMANKKFAEPQIKKTPQWESSPKKVNPYAELLKNPKTVREAIIVSEILRPKHF
ncbi:MAG: hypothetical protein ACK4SF_19665 [Algoriphagus aquaeductus]|jgi:hypothetical protein|uniref:Uncharacterized protein n=1 Tax=Algoriphagus aquaeductus TaxID=475299 RepID=A0A326RQQ1_9BACT|nr:MULTISPECIES: hypothetical protein [Algoriphagus]PZV83154.1 hypothetical protein CLV31_107106 [Algoriphagus aquaeductus]